MTGSENSSLFRISLCVLLFCFLPRWWTVLPTLVFLFVRQRKSIPLYVLLIAIILVTGMIRSDLIPVGIVDYPKGKAYLADKLFYKVRIETERELHPGDILFFETRGSLIEEKSDLKKNIRFLHDSCQVIASFPVRRFLYEKTDSRPDPIRSALIGFLYGQYTSGGLEGISYGLASYYVLKEIKKRSCRLCLVLIVLFTVCFTWQFKYLFLLIEIICERNGFERSFRTSLQILSVCLLNRFLFFNESILIPVILNVFSILDVDLSFRNLLFLMQSFLFGEIDLFQSLLFRPVLIFRIVMYVLSILLLVFPFLEPVYLISLSLMEKILSVHLRIRGSPSAWTILLLLLLPCVEFMKKDILFSLALIVLLLSPLNHPFADVTFVDVGQGDATAIRKGIGYSCILIDTGSGFNYSKLKRYLFSQGIYRIDLLIVTHDDEDHNGNVERLQNDFSVGRIVTEGEDLHYGDLYLDHYDLGTFENDNDNSLVYSLDADGIRFLFTGDITVKAEDVFVRRYCPCTFDVLKVAHHGSDTSSSDLFISSISPRYAIFSTSGKFGHPKETVTDTMDRYKVETFSTHKDGNVSFYFLRSLCFIRTGEGEFVIMKGK